MLSFKLNMFLNHAKTKNWDDVLPQLYGGCTQPKLYGQWPAYSFKTWYDGMN